MINVKKKDINKIIKECKTGDLVLFRWKFIDILVRMVSKYNHIGVIYKTKDKVYLIEMNPEDDKLKEGVHKYNLKKRLKEFKGNCYYSKLNTNTTINKKTFKSSLQKYKKIPFDNDFRYSYTKNFIIKNLNLKTPPQKNSMYCSEFIESLLKDLEILPKTYDLSLSTPSSLDNIYINNKKLYNNVHRISL